MKFGQLEGSDGLGYVRQMEALVQHIAAQTRTPPHYLLGSSGSFPIGRVAEGDRDRPGRQGPAQAALVRGEPGRRRCAWRSPTAATRCAPQAVDVETIWADPESRTEGELVDALLKMRQLGVPITALWARWGASPQQIKQWSLRHRAARARRPGQPDHRAARAATGGSRTASPTD